MDPNIGTLNNCLRVVDERADIFVLVVGCRYGSVTESGHSITNMEYLRAKAKGIPIYTFVDKKILNVLPLWRDNSESNFQSTVDTPKLFEFVDSFRNNDGIWSFGFEMAQDIIDTLRNQLGYLFYDSLEFRQKTITRKFSKKILGLDGICFQTVLLRPVAWEYKLFGQVLASGLNELSDKRRDFNYSFTLTSVKRLQTFNELFDYITSKSEQLLRSISYISTLIYETIPDAFGAPGVDGDPDYIIYAANKLVEIYGSIIDWSLDFNTIMTEEDFRGLAKSFSKMCDVTLSDIERFSSEFSEMTRKIPDNISDENLTMKFNITLSLSEPNTDDFYCEIKKLQQKFGI